MADHLTREEKRRQSRTAYWRRFRETGKRRIYGTLSAQEYRDIKAVASRHGRSVFAQIWTESLAYRQQRFVPTKEIEAQVVALYVLLRRIANSVNQLARERNIFGKLKRPAAVLEELARLEQAVADFVAQPWKEADDSEVDE